MHTEWLWVLNHTAHLFHTPRWDHRLLEKMVSPLELSFSRKQKSWNGRFVPIRDRNKSMNWAENYMIGARFQPVFNQQQQVSACTNVCGTGSTNVCYQQAPMVWSESTWGIMPALTWSSSSSLRLGALKNCSASDENKGAGPQLCACCVTNGFFPCSL